MTSLISIPKDFVLDITQAENGSTGYLFDVDTANQSGVVHIERLPSEEKAIEASQIVFGASRPATFRISALKEGKVKFNLSRPWDKEPAVSIEIVVT